MVLLGKILHLLLVLWFVIHIDHAYLLAGMSIPDVGVNLRSLLGPQCTIRTFEAGFEAALVREVSLEVALEREPALALGAVVLLLAPLNTLGAGPGRWLVVLLLDPRAVDEEVAHHGVCKQRERERALG